MAWEANRVNKRPLRSYLPLVCLLLAMMLGGFNYRCLVTALPTFLSGESMTSRGLAKMEGGLAVFLVLIVGGLGQYFGGWRADGLRARRVYLGLVGLLVPLSLVLSSLGGTPSALLVASLVAFCLFAQQPIENTLLADYTSAGRRSASYGTKFALTFGVGALGGQVVGMIWHEFGFLGPVFYLFAGSAAFMAVLISLLPPSNRFKVPDKPPRAGNGAASSPPQTASWSPETAESPGSDRLDIGL